MGLRDWWRGKTPQVAAPLPTAAELRERTQSGADLPHASYRVGGVDRHGRLIEVIYSHYPHYIVYVTGGALQIEGNTTELDGNPQVSALLSRAINLCPNVMRVKRQTFAQLAVAVDQCMASHPAEALASVTRVIAQLSDRARSAARLHYVWSGAIAVTVLWLIFLACLPFRPADDALLWLQVIAFGGTGALFSVILNQQTIPIDVDDTALVHWTAGASRVLVGMIAGTACYLAIKSRVALNFAESSDHYTELFFCFLSGFSESFVPNLLKGQETAPRTVGK
ncbi:MAG TPA: hypothetical protein VGG48_01245 [Rhizomicrobium sp.]|jgi:hypothetical protein